MLNIVIPMAGRGRRYSNVGYDLPKPLINVVGAPMIKRVIDNLAVKQEHRFIFIVDNQGAKDPPYQIYNIGSSNPKYVAEFIQILVEELKRAGILPDNFLLNEHVQFSAMQQGDMLATYADVSSLIQDFGYQPTTELRDGLRHFAIWYKEYYKILPEV